MLAYLFWHCPYSTTTAKQYEQALRFQQHLRQQDPPGFRGSASFRIAGLPWLGNRAGYEDWCLLDGSWKWTEWDKPVGAVKRFCTLQAQW